MSKAAIVIRTRNEGAFLRRTLKKVFAQREVEPEVIVVDSGSTDDTLEIARAFPVKLVELAKEQFTYGRALNLGFEASSAPVIACLSAHALPLDRHWLRNLIRPFDDPRVDAVVGKTLPHDDCNPFDRRGLRRRYGTRPRFLLDGQNPGFSNANSAVRRSAWEEDPFDEELSYSEDVVWARRRLGRGRVIFYAPDAAVYHSHNETPRRLSRRFWAESRAREKLDPHHRRYRLAALCWDLAAGTAYDLWTVLVRRAGRHWAGFAPRRRLAINLGRYAGSRGIEWPERNSLWRPVADRQWLRAVRFFGALAGRLAPRLVVFTRKHSTPIHPRQLLADRRDHFWYEERLAAGSRALICGRHPGVHAHFVDRRNLKVVVFGADAQSLNRARFLLRWEGAKQAMVLRARANDRFPFRDRAFDCVLAFEVLEYLDRPERMLSECGRVLRENGLLLVSAPKADTDWKMRCRRAGLPFFADREQRFHYTRQGLYRAMREAGFEVLGESPVLSDTPWAPWHDLLGAFSLRLYERLTDNRRQRALRDPDQSTGFRLAARKVGE